VKKIVFIEPKNSNPHIYSQFKLPRLGTFILAAMMKNRGWDAEVIFEDYSELCLEEIAKAELVGISTITATAPRAYAIADALKRKGATIIMGGPHVTYQVDEALTHCDYVVRGEGERILMAFIDEWEGTRDFSRVAGLSYLKEGLVIDNPANTVMTDLDSIPFPDFSAARGNVHCVISGYKTIPIQTSRGCPFNCSFCSVTGMFGKKYRYRSTENILRELRQYDDRKNILFFCDDNFTDNKKRAKELLRAMIKERFKFKWSTQARTDIAKDPELIELMKAAGCMTLFIGFESVDPESLKVMKKGQTVDHIKTAIKEIRRHGINIHGMFVYGFDTDTEETVQETIRFARRSGITSAQFLILTPLPGAEIYRQYKDEGRIIFKDWGLFDTHHVVFRPQKIGLVELQRAQVMSHDRFYALGQIVKKLLRGDFIGVGIALYARALNREWKRKNKLYCKVLELLIPRSDIRLSIDYAQRVSIPGAYEKAL
jgi:radical SAM superfamily enzyme YgiQ (UPF0313 family)